jgi:hypothetical protein
VRHASLILLLLLSSLFTSCSYSSDFVVVNASSHAIEVRYMIRWLLNEPFFQTGKPAILPASQMQSRVWPELPPDRYAFDRSSRTATVSVKPGEALRILHGREYMEYSVGAEKNFLIEELHISEESGGLSLKGDQVYHSFVPTSTSFFGPPTLIVLTYK